MQYTGTNKRLFFLLSILIIGSILLSAGLLLREAECYVKCSPVIGVTNYPYFSSLLQNIVRDRFIVQLKLYLLNKLDIEFMPGNLVRTLAGVYVDGTTDFSSTAGSVVGKGLASQMDYIKKAMGVEAFGNHLNSVVRGAALEELLKTGFDKRHAQRVVDNYERYFLNSGRARATYENMLCGLQNMAGEHMSLSARLSTGMAGLAGKIDIAERIQGRQGAGGIANTLGMLKECGVHAQNGLKNIAVIAGIDIGGAIEGPFCSMNAHYLKESLEKIRDVNGNILLSDENIEKVIAAVNTAAAHAVPDHLSLTTGTLNNMAALANTSLSRNMKDSIDSSYSLVKRTMFLEKEKDLAANRLFATIEKDVKKLIGNTKQIETTARNNKQMSLLNEESIKNVSVLLTGKNSSVTQRKLAVKHYITAHESLEMSNAMKTTLSGFDPGSIDRSYEDMAWKDITRLNYCSLVISNQRLKLLAIRAMTESLDTGDPLVARHIIESGLPHEF